MSDPFAGLELPVDAPARMTIMHPTTGLPLKDQDGREGWIDLYSTDSEIARRHLRATANKRLSQRNPGRQNAEQIEDSTVAYFVVLTAGWHLVSLDGAALTEIPHTADNARRLYSSSRMSWLREQVDAFVSDRANFTPTSSQT